MGNFENTQRTKRCTGRQSDCAPLPPASFVVRNTTIKTTVSTYRKDRLYPKIVKATAEILKETDEICPVTILMKMGNLTRKDYDAWRRGAVRYLERIFQGGLSKANRILRIIGFHANDLNMVPSQNT